MQHFKTTKSVSPPLNSKGDQEATQSHVNIPFMVLSENDRGDRGCRQVGSCGWPAPGDHAGAAVIELTHLPAFDEMKIHMPGNQWWIVL